MKLSAYYERARMFGFMVIAIIVTLIAQFIVKLFE
jgi:hypothetical protein